MKSVLISIRPQWCDLIASGKKTIEVRKTRPKIDTPFKCYIYETKRKTDVPTFIDEDGHYIYEGRGQVIGEFVCDEIIDGRAGPQHWIYICENSMLSCQQIYSYCGEDADGNTKYCWGWHISDLVIYDKPKELSEFYVACPGIKQVGKCDKCDKTVGKETVECDNGKVRLIHPPQSWRYVEERKE